MPKRQKTPKTREKKQISFFRSIGFRMTISFLIPVCFIILLGIVSYQKAADAITESYETSTKQTLDSMNNYLALAIDTVQSAYKSYNSDQVVSNYFRGLVTDSSEAAGVQRDYTKTLIDSTRADALVSNIFLLGDGQQAITSTQLKDTDLYSVYAKTKQGAMASADQYSYYLFGNECEADTALKTDSSKYGLRLARRLSQGQIIMLVDINRSVLVDTLASLNAGKGSFAGLITIDGTEFYSAGSDAEDSAEIESNTEAGFSIVDTDFYKKIVDSEALSGEEYVTYNGEEYLFLYSKLDGRSAALVSMIPTATISAQAGDIRSLTIAITLIASVLAIILGTLIATSFSKAISHIVKNLKKVAGGDLTVEITTKRKDEFAILCEGIRNMIDHMKVLLSNVSDVSVELAQASNMVTTTSDLFMESSQNIQSSLSEIETGTQKLDADSADCLVRMDALSGQLKNITESTTEIHNMTQSTSHSIEMGLSSVTQLNESAYSTYEITQNVIGSIEALSEKSKSIGEITTAINEIAEETSLLSLNASIEAARAGDAGRGFNVVAEQIKKLSNQSIEASEEISKIIMDIIANTAEAVNVAKQSELIVSKQKETVQITAEAFQSIKDQVNGLVTALNAITSHMDEMELDRKSTLDAVESMSAISTETAAGTSTVSSSTSEQLSAVDKLQAESERMKLLSEQLTTLMERFQL